MSDFTLQNNDYKPTAGELALMAAYTPTKKKDWGDVRFEPFKQNIRAKLLLHQFDRCAYCRRKLEGAGKYEPLDHIVPKSLRPKWLRDCNNLILTCNSCNNLKKHELTLTAAYAASNTLPNVTAAYTIFNPYYESWTQHLAFEDDIFITAVPNSKGKETIRVCKLFRFNVIVNRALELKIGQKEPAKRVMNRLNNLDKTSAEYTQIVNEFSRALTHFIERMNDNPAFN